MKTYQNTDKSDWGDGPWQDEPDKAVWIDEATGLDCMIHRGPSGALCGYVGVVEGHPFFEMHRDDVDVDAHEGLTFTNYCDPEASEADGICHLPEPGRPKEVWWLGFDCAHAFDFTPGINARTRNLPFPEDMDSELRQRVVQHATEEYEGVVDLRKQPGPLYTTYKDFEYVRREVAKLARQVAARAAGIP